MKFGLDLKNSEYGESRIYLSSINSTGHFPKTNYALQFQSVLLKTQNCGHILKHTKECNDLFQVSGILRKTNHFHSIISIQEKEYHFLQSINLKMVKIRDVVKMGPIINQAFEIFQFME